MPRRFRRLHRALGALALMLLTIFAVSCSALRSGTADDGRPCVKSVPDIFDRVSPAVVFIAATSINPYRLNERVVNVVGSGVLYDAAGLILTNSHVVFNRQSVTVTLDDGSAVPAELVGADPIFDIAVLRISVPSAGKLSLAPLGDSDRLRVGEDVVAIGNPLGLDQSLTRGVVSAINRILPETPFSVQEPLIQTDAPINPGNSGGPLLNRCGEVIGINTAIISDAQNIGFAIPINLVKTMLPSLVREGRIVRPWLGFHGTVAAQSLRELFRIPLVEGLLVEVVEPGSPAAKAGIRGGRIEFSLGGKSLLIGGDIVTTVNEIRLTSPEHVSALMRSLKVGSTVRMTVYREGDYREVEYVLPERPLLPSDLPESRTFTPTTRGQGAPPPPVTPGPAR